MVQGRLASTEEVLQFIARDRQAFQNARRSRNYSTFLDTARKTLALTHKKWRELFITHNLSPEDWPFSIKGSIDRAHGRNPCPFPRGLL